DYLGTRALQAHTWLLRHRLALPSGRTRIDRRPVARSEHHAHRFPIERPGGNDDARGERLSAAAAAAPGSGDVGDAHAAVLLARATRLEADRSNLAGRIDRNGAGGGAARKTRRAA